MAIAPTLAVHSEFGALGGTTSGADTSAYTALVVVLDYYKAGGANLSDSKGNTWTKVADGIDPVTNCACTMYYCDAPTVGTGHTFTTTSQYCGLTAIGITGEATSFYDTSSGRGGIDGSPFTTFQPGSVTPSVNDCLLITSAYQAAATGGVSTPSGYTSLANWGLGSAFPGGVAYKIQGTAAADNPTWGVSPTSNVAANIAVFKPAATATSDGNFLMFM